jgi:1-pyrroline-5-carboxylate dehydrogenase
MYGIQAQRALRSFSSNAYPPLSSWATLDPKTLMAPGRPHKQYNLLNGEWRGTAAYETIVDPLGGGAMLSVPLTSDSEAAAFGASMVSTPKTGLHNPFRNIERYVMLGKVSGAAGAALRDPEILSYFSRLVQRTSPKSYKEAEGEVKVCAAFLENFAGDNVRFLARGFSVPGNHDGQRSNGFRFPFGGVAIITPFNFPIEIPCLQAMGALFMGNKPLIKVDSKVSVVMEEFMRLLHAVGLPKGDADLVHCDGPTFGRLIKAYEPRMTLFTGSAKVAEALAVQQRGKVKLEDAGFDWKILGPDVPCDPKLREYVAWQSDQDAYACSGQKCSAQSCLFVHKNWVAAGLLDRLASLAGRRRLEDLTIGPVLTWTTAQMQAHVKALCSIPGAKLLFGGKALTGHSIPPQYGAMEATAVSVPLEEALKAAHYATVTREVFGPVQVVLEWSDEQLPLVLQACERMEHHLTAGVVSNDPVFTSKVMGSTVNGTQYIGWRARTTGAPQNHWFGPSGDPRGAGIGTKEAIQLVWSSHREIIEDWGPVASGWTLPPPS